MTQKCKFCGRPILWGETESGEIIPLDPKASIYLAIGGVGDNLKITRGGGFVSHSHSCPGANNNSLNKQGGQNGQGK